MSSAKGLYKNRWHVNPETGDVGLCNATKKTCPYGGEEYGDTMHFPTREAAQTAVEEHFEDLYGGSLPESAQKTLAANKSRMVLDSKPTEEAAVFTDILVEKGLPAKLSGNSVRFNILNKNADRPGDEYGDLTANARYIDSGKNKGKWLFNYYTPKNEWYGSSRLLQGSGNIILNANEVEKWVRELVNDPEKIVAALHATDRGW